MRAPEISDRDIRQLRYAEHLIVWLLRSSVTCPSNCHIILREFDNAFGPFVDQASAGLEALLLALSKGGRSITLGRPGHIEITHDELSLLAACHAAQGAQRGVFDAHARWILGRCDTDALFAAVYLLTDLLQRRGHGFRPVARTSAPARPEYTALPRAVV